MMESLEHEYEAVKAKLREVLDAVENDGVTLQKMLFEILQDKTGVEL